MRGKIQLDSPPCAHLHFLVGDGVLLELNAADALCKLDDDGEELGNPKRKVMIQTAASIPLSYETKV